MIIAANDVDFNLPPAWIHEDTLVYLELVMTDLYETKHYQRDCSHSPSVHLDHTAP
jgi:hypothetical protein